MIDEGEDTQLHSPNSCRLNGQIVQTAFGLLARSHLEVDGAELRLLSVTGSYAFGDKQVVHDGDLGLIATESPS
jgi:hypothetical protein